MAKGEVLCHLLRLHVKLQLLCSKCRRLNFVIKYITCIEVFEKGKYPVNGQLIKKLQRTAPIFQANTRQNKGAVLCKFFG